MGLLRLLAIIFVFSCSTKNVEKQNATYQDPSLVFNELFTHLKEEESRGNTKWLADANALTHANDIRTVFRKSSKSEEFDFDQFLDNYFELPNYTLPAIESSSMNEWKEIAFSSLYRKDTSHSFYSSLIPLPYPYYAAGDNENELHYWEAYFIILKLMRENKKEEARQLVDNFAWLIDQFGFVPGSNRTYSLSRSQPPVFPLMVSLIADSVNKLNERYLPQMMAEYAYWMDGYKSLNPAMSTYKRVVRLKSGDILNRYWDDNPLPRAENYVEDIALANEDSRPNAEYFLNVRAAAESGWESSARWLADVDNTSSFITTEYIPVDLNSLMYQMELTIGKTWQDKNNLDSADYFFEKADKRRNAINKFCWNQDMLFYQDYHYPSESSSPRATIAGAFPLYLNVAKPIQGVFAGMVLMQEFYKPGGFITSLDQSGLTMDYPNVWAPLQWITVRAMENYGFGDFSLYAATNFVNHIERKFNGFIPEIYNGLDTTELFYPATTGLGASIGVHTALDLYAKELSETEITKLD